ncbi:LysE family translocator [Vannielia sp.]|uniref:LysE family translocator n=1 Tax=Vannielia sp. TaxID=2813045 RepID=UPI0026246F92|nr:LysE family translocator [Vannielia sp.]MDF1873433.1 LysE family translocator [Vannielia sp.]
MSVEHLIAFNIALLAAIASPGPALLVAIQTTLSSGRKAGIAIGYGLGLMAVTWTLLALLGLETIFQLFPWAYSTAKLIGAIYLIYIAWGMWRGAADRIEAKEQPARRSFRQGVLINMLNPKSVLFAAAVLVVIFPSDMVPMDNAIVVLNHLLVEMVFYTALAYGMNTAAVRTKYLKAKVYTDRTASVILGALGLRLMVGR